MVTPLLQEHLPLIGILFGSLERGTEGRIGDTKPGLYTLPADGINATSLRTILI